MPESKKAGHNNFFNILKNIFLLLLFLQFAPIILMNIKNYFQEMMIPKTEVGKLVIKGFLGDSTFYVKKIDEFLKNDDIKALFIKIDSPGGLPGTAQAICGELKRFKNKKPIIVFVENICTSAAYYVASVSDYIIASPSALMGGIGVFMQLPNIKGLMDDWKVKFKHIQSGKYKTAGSPLKEHTPEEIEYLQKLSDDNYQQFISDIAQNRKLNNKNYKIWADGKVFLGNKALKLNLIDSIGSLHDAIDKIKEIAQIDTDINFITPPAPSLIQKLFTSQGEEDYEMASLLYSIYDKLIIKQSEIKIF